jgi:hypothetical protein
MHQNVEGWIMTDDREFGRQEFVKYLREFADNVDKGSYEFGEFRIENIMDEYCGEGGIMEPIIVGKILTVMYRGRKNG